MLKTTARSSVITLAIASTFLLAPALSQAAAARIDFAVGDVKAVAADGRSRPLAKGAEVAAGELVDTGSGRAQLRFSDGALMALAPQTQFRIDEYQFNGKTDGSERGFFSLVKGAMRTITGLVGKTNRERYKVTTTVATIGIRGTEYSVTYGPSNDITTTTGEGSTEVCNAVGCLILNSGETAFVPDSGTKPVMTDKRAEIPPPPPEPIATLISGNDTDKEGKPEYLMTAPETPSLPPLASGVGSLAAAHVVNGGGFSAGILGGSLTFDASGALKSFSDGTWPLMGYAGAVLAEYGNDGIIGWGRWSGGVHTDSIGTATPLAGMSYVAGLSSNVPTIATITGTYTSFASTAPVIFDSGGSVVSTGMPNSVTSTLNVNFTNPGAGGSLSYMINIPIGGNTYVVNGTAHQYANVGFLGDSYASITLNGTACPSCLGSIPFGDAIQGFFTGPNAERAGANYGFSVSSGTLTGAVVYKQ